MTRLSDSYKEIEGLVGRKVRGVSISVDPVSKCILLCPSCATGAYHNIRPQATMTVERFTEMLDKIGARWKIRQVMLYNHSDSLLHPELDRLISICNERGIDTLIGTVMQTVRCDLAKVIAARPSEFRLGWSGWKNCNKYQKGFTMERLHKWLEVTDKLPRHPETKWNCFFHSYRENQDEIEPARKFMEEHGFNFIVIPAIFQVLEKIVRQDYNEQDRECISWMWETPEEMLERVKPGDYCPLIRKWINMDAQGNTTLCNNLYSSEFVVGNIYTDTVQAIQARMEKHPFCGECKAKGVHNMHACYSSPLKDDQPVQKQYRRFRWQTPWAR